MDKMSLEKIKAGWKEFGDLLERMENSGKITGLDAELLKQKLSCVYEDLIKSVSTQQEQGGQTEATKSGKVPGERGKDNFTSEVNPTEVFNTPDDSIPLTQKPKERDRKIAEEIIRKREIENYPVEADPKTAIKPESIESKKTAEVISDKFQGTQKFMHEKLAEKVLSTKKDLTSSLQSKPIENIEKAIGINDKFLFIKELFQNNGQVYKETVEHLNHLKSEEEALNYIAENLSWDSSDPVVEKFTELVRRRYL
jgi:hypothetical protein